VWSLSDLVRSVKLLCNRHRSSAPRSERRYRPGRGESRWRMVLLLGYCRWEALERYTAAISRRIERSTPRTSPGVAPALVAVPVRPDPDPPRSLRLDFTDQRALSFFPHPKVHRQGATQALPSPRPSRARTDSQVSARRFPAALLPHLPSEPRPTALSCRLVFGSVAVPHLPPRLPTLTARRQLAAPGSAEQPHPL